MAAITEIEFCYTIVDKDHEVLTDLGVLTETSNATISKVLETIKQCNINVLDGIGSNAITMWKLTMPLEAGVGQSVDEKKVLAERIKKLQFPSIESQSALEGQEGFMLMLHRFRLANYFPSSPLEGLLHVIVEKPTFPPISIVETQGPAKRRRLDETRNPELVIIERLTSVRPSTLSTTTTYFKELAGDVIHINRPRYLDDLPINLLQPEFGTFKDICSEDPPASAYEHMKPLVKAVCAFYPNESSRMEAVRAVLEDPLKLNLFAMQIHDGKSITDGNTSYTIIPSLIRECKNESGQSGTGVFQATAYYGKFLWNAVKKDYINTRFPSILMIDMGSYLGFYGCVWLGTHVLVEPLTPMLEYAVNPTDEQVRRAIAASIQALIETVPLIESHYRKPEIKMTPELLHRRDWMEARRFPFQTEYQDKTGLKKRLRYIRREHKKLVFYAEDEKEGSELCVKFTRRYSAKAHCYLAERGWAPTLHCCTEHAGGWFMVVMDLSPFTPLYQVDFSVEEQAQMKRKIEGILKIFHGGGFVHGDIRSTNILVEKGIEGKAKLEGAGLHIVDFDWAGNFRKAEVKYPNDISTEVRRPDRVKGGGNITLEDDIGMCSYLFDDVFGP